MRRVRFLIPMVAMALVAGACSGSSEGGAESTDSTAAVALGGADVPGELAAEFDADLAPLPEVAVEPDSVLPGETVEVSGLEDAVGSVRIVGPAGVGVDEPVTGSHVSVKIPSDASPGRYLVVAESADGLPAVAPFRVGGGPVLTLAVDGDGLVVTADGVPLDTPAAIAVGTGDRIQLLEAGPGGLLLPVSRQPEAVLADYLGNRLEIPPTVQGEMRLLVGEEEGGDRRRGSRVARRDPVV